MDDRRNLYRTAHLQIEGNSLIRAEGSSAARLLTVFHSPDIEHTRSKKSWRIRDLIVHETRRRLVTMSWVVSETGVKIKMQELSSAKQRWSGCYQFCSQTQLVINKIFTRVLLTTYELVEQPYISVIRWWSSSRAAASSGKRATTT